MNDPGPEVLADPTLIMLRDPHLGGTRDIANSGTTIWEHAHGRQAACPTQNRPRRLHESTQDVTAQTGTNWGKIQNLMSHQKKPLICE